MARKEKKETIQSRILKANLILILLPMGVLGIIAISQLSVLGQTIGQDGQNSITSASVDALKTQAADVGSYVNTYLSQVVADLNRVANYERDLFNNNINITGTRSSYKQGDAPPVTVYSARYGANINTTYSDYTNAVALNPWTTELVTNSSYMDYVCDSVFSGNNATYTNISVVFELGISRVFPYVQGGRNPATDVRLAPWYVSAKAALGTIIYNQTYASTNAKNPALLVAKAVYNQTGLLGCVAIEVDLTSLRAEITQKKAQQSGYVMLVDKNGDAIAHKNMSTAAFQSINNLESGITTTIVNLMKAGYSGTNNYTKASDSKLWAIGYAPVGLGGYSVASVAPMAEITAAGTQLQDALAALNGPMVTVFIFVLIGIVVFIGFLIVRMSHRVTRPITDLTASIDGMAHGNLTQEIAIDAKHKGDEIGKLAQSFQALLVTMRLGNEKYYQGDTFVAFKNYAAALELFKTTNNVKGQGICLNNLGNIYRDWGEYAKAREAFDGAIQIAKADKNFGGLSSRLNNRGLLALAASDWVHAEEDFNDAMNIDKEIQAEDRIATRKRNLGVLNFLRDNDKQARKYIEEALEIDTRLGVKAGLAEDHFQLGRLDLKANNLDGAEQHFTTALAIAKDFGNNPLARNILGQLVSLYDQQDNTTALHKAEAELAKINDLLVRKKDVIFVIDQSGSMQEQNKIRSAKRGALEVFNMTINPGDRVAIIGFHSIVNEILPPTTKGGNVENIQKTFLNVDYTPYQTAFYDALGKAIDALKDAPLGFQHWVVALTDGQDNSSKRFNPKTLAKYIQELKFPLNLVLIGVGRELQNVFYEMNMIVTAAPRGKYIPIYAETNLAKQIEGAFKQVQEILASSEIEGFTPEEK